MLVSHSVTKLVLSETFAAVPSIIGSEQMSPAAVRLAVQLTFAVYVLGPQLADTEVWPENGYVHLICGLLFV